MNATRLLRTVNIMIISTAAIGLIASPVNTVPVGPAAAPAGGNRANPPSSGPSGGNQANLRGGGNLRGNTGGGGGGGGGGVPRYGVNPTVVTTPVRPPMGPVQPYTPVESGQLTEYSISTPRLDPVSARSTTETILARVERRENGMPEGTAQAKVLDVMDRGTLVLDSYDEIKLRGVRVPSENETQEVTRYYAGAATQALKQQLFGQNVLIKLGDPQRGTDGKLLADVFLLDGTHINKQILELGYGMFDSADFAITDQPIQLQAAEVRAREQKRGLFSRNITRGDDVAK